MTDREHSLELIESSQAASLLALAVSVRGPEDGFPALLGVSVRSRRSGVVDLLPQEVDHPRTVVCLIEHPERIGDVDRDLQYSYSGEITIALWADSSYETELARIPWRGWGYADPGSLNPYSRVDPCTAAYMEHDFAAMRERYAGELRWVARRVDDS